METLDKAYLAAKIADSMKAEDIALLDLSGLCAFTDCFVVATCSSSTLLRSTAHRTASRTRSSPVCGDLVVHLFHPEARAFYRLEDLWANAKKRDWTSLAPQTAGV